MRGGREILDKATAALERGARADAVARQYARLALRAGAVPELDALLAAYDSETGRLALYGVLVGELGLQVAAFRKAEAGGAEAATRFPKAANPVMSRGDVAAFGAGPGLLGGDVPSPEESPPDLAQPNEMIAEWDLEPRP